MKSLKSIFVMKNMSFSLLRDVERTVFSLHRCKNFLFENFCFFSFARNGFICFQSDRSNDDDDAKCVSYHIQICLQIYCLQEKNTGNNPICRFVNFLSKKTERIAHWMLTSRCKTTMLLNRKLFTNFRLSRTSQR